ncbi:MAG: bifunctional pyr operon transcriptional regulator/uracil phosphoribosyltransferase PyrR [Clostridia bacterium]|nr:bifunctional pyr operon transcriptional regulator/uracil phosphoribosyltransferase PyrR [Clostridia bacterium]
MKLKATILDEDTIKRTLMRISHQIVEKNSDIENVCLVGIKTRGVPIAEILGENIYAITGVNVPVGVLDITLYRDDIPDKDPVIKKSDLGFSVENKCVILVDDVIYTGRTVRCAMDAVMRNGRPAMIQLAAMVDRGHRELPIRADYVGKNLPTSRNEVVRVNLKKTDNIMNVELYEKTGDCNVCKK